MTITQQLRTELSGRYEIDREIGQGGMATVYLARDVRHNRPVAVKVLNPDLGAVLGVERFLSEIETTANLQHPNLLPLFDSGAAGTLFYYVMPFIDGESLRARLDREKQLPVDEAIRLIVAVAHALDHAHRHGVIHRDLKPENILLQDGQPLVADFGIALAVANAGGNRITQTGLSLGTPSYMSPEQATGDRSIDARTDVYSLAAVAYEMLAGDPPHVGSTSQAIIARLLTEKPRSIRTTRPNVPMHVEAAIEHALEKLPADRFGTAKEFAEALTRPSSFSAMSVSGATAALPRAGASPRVGTREKAITGVALVALSACGWLAFRASQPPAIPPLVTFQLELPDDLQPRSANSAGSVAVSRDGSLIVFQAGYNGVTGVALFARRLNAPGVQLIRGTEGGTRPVISPNGTELLFSANQSLKRVPIEGGVPETIVDAAGFSSWGDGNHILYEVLPVGSIWMVSPNGGSPTLLAAPDSARRHVQYGKPHVLPGGTSALITVRKERGSLDSMYLAVVAIPSGNVTELGIRGAWPTYSDGHLLYATTDNWLMAVPYSTTDSRITGTPERVQYGVRVGRGGAAGFGASQNGVIATLNARGLDDSGLELIAVSRSGVERSLGMSPGFVFAPRVSPDGKQIALTMPARRPTLGDLVSVDPDIWKFDIASKVLTRITADSASRHAEWYADGRELLYVHDDSTIVSRPINTTGAPTVIARLNRQIVSMSVNAIRRLVAFGTVSLGPDRRDIMIASVDSVSPPTRFLGESYSEEAPEISPDGRWIAYSTYRSGRSEVYVRPVVGNAQEVQVSVNAGFDPRWSRSGRELFYRVSGYTMSARVSASEPIEVLRRDTLFADPYSDARFRNYDVFPGDQEFVVLRLANDTIGPGQIHVIANWKGGQRIRK